MMQKMSIQSAAIKAGLTIRGAHTNVIRWGPFSHTRRQDGVHFSSPKKLTTFYRRYV